MTSEDIRRIYDPELYDVDAMVIDNDNHNFDPDWEISYLKTEIVRRSIINGQWKQARDKSEEWGIDFDEMRASVRESSMPAARG